MAKPGSSPKSDKEKAAKKTPGEATKQKKRERAVSRVHSKNMADVSLPEIISETIVEFLHEFEGDSPIDLQWNNCIKIQAAHIVWTNYDETLPAKLTIKNTGYNAIIRAVYPNNRTPYVSKGPLAAKYEFAQIHFHWGADSKGGSDHTVNGQSLPFEVHSVFYKASAGSLEEAKKEEDGIVIFCYLFKISPDNNEKFQPIVDAVNEIEFAHSSRILESVPLSVYLDSIVSDYVVYLGYMKYKAVHGVTFIIARQAYNISEEQLDVFRKLKDRHENIMILKKPLPQPTPKRNVFIVNPNLFQKTNSVLYSLPEKRTLTSHPSMSESYQSTGHSAQKKGKKKGSGKKKSSERKLSKKSPAVSKESKQGKGKKPKENKNKIKK